MTIRIALAVSALAASIALIPAPLHAQTAPAPAAPAAAADPTVMNNPNPEALQVYGLPGGAQPKHIKDPKVQFEKAIRVETPGGGNPWTVGVNSPLTAPVKKGDKGLVAF